MTNNILKLNGVDNENIAHHYPAGDHDFYHQDLDEGNIADMKEWMDKNEMVGLVSEKHGGIIGYIHKDHADDITTILNLHVIERFKKQY